MSWIIPSFLPGYEEAGCQPFQLLTERDQPLWLGNAQSHSPWHASLDASTQLFHTSPLRSLYGSYAFVIPCWVLQVNETQNSQVTTCQRGKVPYNNKWDIVRIAKNMRDSGNMSHMTSLMSRAFFSFPVCLVPCTEEDFLIFPTPYRMWERKSG